MIRKFDMSDFEQMLSIMDKCEEGYEGEDYYAETDKYETIVYRVYRNKIVATTELHDGRDRVDTIYRNGKHTVRYK